MLENLLLGNMPQLEQWKKSMTTTFPVSIARVSGFGISL